MENLLFFMISFVFIFLVLLVNYFIKKYKKKIKYMKEIRYLINTYKLDQKKLNYNVIALITILLNSFIISMTALICTNIDLNYFWKLAIGFVLLMSSIYIFYGMLGKILKRREK